MTEHMSINCIDLGNLNIKCFGSCCNHKVDAAYSYLALADNVGNLVYGVVKAVAESVCEVVDKSLTAAVFGIFNRILCCRSRYIGQEYVAPAPW